MVQGYFDESGTHQGAAVTCVAGYLFESDQCIRFDAEWKEALSEAGLPHFHMAACANGSGMFRGKSMSERIDLEKKLIGIIKRRMLLGLVVSVRTSDLAIAASEQDVRTGSAYVLCLLWCIAGVAAWVAKRGYTGHISYFFESGHQLSGRAHAAMEYLSRNPTLRAGARYNAHAFVSKEQATPVQAADILAWQWYKDCIRGMGTKRRTRRLDLENLLSAPHITSHLSAEHLHAMSQTYASQLEFVRRFHEAE